MKKIGTFKFMEEEILPKKKKSKRGRETLFRATYQNQNNLIQMADNKANIIISINTMIISSIIAITGYGAVAGKIDSYGVEALAPIIMIILSCLVSVIFAIQAARPKLIKAKVVGGSMQKSSLLFFGVIAGYSQKEYLEKMENLLGSGNELYEHMTIDLYNQGLVLKRKYNLLVYAYQVFMFGFILSVLIFLAFLAMG
jgi:Family of unknown function (DUF5706)